MQRAISDKIQLGETLNPKRITVVFLLLMIRKTLENLIGKVDKVPRFVKAGKADGGL